MSAVGDVVGDVVGGITGAKQAGEAAAAAGATQAAAAEEGVGEQRRQFDAIVEMMAPYLGAGTGALSQQQALLGLGIPAQYEETPYTGEQLFTKQLEALGMTPQDFASKSTGVQSLIRKMAEKQSVAPMRTMVSPAVSADEAQRMAIERLQASPQYGALVSAGEEAILQGASATGGLRGGNVQGALAQFRPQILSQLIESQYAKLGGLSAQGQSAAGLQAGAGQASAANIANLLGQAGAARAGGQLAQGQVAGQAFGTLAGGAGAFVGAGGMPGLKALF